MLQINVSQQLKEPIGSTRDYEVNEVVDMAGGDSQVQGKVRLVRTDRAILVQGMLQTEVRLTCSRCLSLCSCPLTLNIEEEYFPKTDILSGAPVPVPEESGGFTIDKHHILDLVVAIRQQAALVTPMKPLCREDCAGLCPSCGHNLNQGACGCPPSEADQRWAALRKLAVTSSNDV